MARRTRKGEGGSPLLEKGLLAVVIGCALLAAPLMLTGSPMLRPVVQGLRTPAWLAIGIGLLLLAAHHVIERARGQDSSSDLRQERSTHPGSRDMFPPEVPPAPGESRRPRDANTATAASSPARFAAPPGRQTQWSKQVFSDIEWRRFEAVCERVFAQGGFKTKSESHGADGGVDIWLYSNNHDGPAAVVQCKHWIGKPVGVKELREFFGVMASKDLKRGTFATTSTFTPAAIEFANETGINLVDADRLLALIGRRTPAQQQEALAVAYEGEYWKPTCASCGVKLVERTATKDGSRFWGCANFPKCRTTMPTRAV
jgi:restriction system protein